MNTVILYRSAIVVLVSIILGIVGLTVWVAPSLYRSRAQQLDTLQALLGSASILNYGTVVSVDAPGNTIVVDVVNRFNAGQPNRIRYAVELDAYIARQELRRGPDGSYTALSAAITSPLSAVQVGDRVAILIGRDANNVISTDYILFGNPL